MGDERYPENIKDLLREYDKAVGQEQKWRLTANDLAEELRNHGVPNHELLEGPARPQLAEDAAEGRG